MLKEKCSQGESGIYKFTNLANGKIYPGLISPDGLVYKDIKSLSEFCREHNLKISSINKLARSLHKTILGWRNLEYGITRKD